MRQILNLKSYFTFLSRNKLYAGINMSGLSVSFAFVILIGLYYYHESRIDQHIPQKEQVYGLVLDVENEKMSGSSREIIKLLQKQLPQVESGCALYANEDVRLSVDQSNNVKVTMLFTDSTFYPIFQRPLAEGSASAALASLNDVVISRRLAQELFPDGQALGKTIIKGYSTRLHVKGIFEPMEDTSLPDADIIGRYELLREQIPWLFDIGGNFGSSDVVLKLKPGTDVVSLEKNINGILEKFYKEKFKLDCTFKLIPFSDTYFSSYDSTVCKRGKQALVYIASLIGLLILLFSIMNYINLTTALTGYRSHEMATRRLLGSQKSEVMLRLIVESICLCVCSVIVAILLAWALVPAANQLLSTTYGISALFEGLPLAILLSVVVVVGVLAGLIPALIMSRVKPIDVVRGTFRRQTKMLFSKAFIIVQNIITISCIALAAIFSHQVRHLVSAPLGYETKGVMEVMVPQDARQADLFKKTLQRLPCVQAASVCLCSPLEGGFNQMVYVNNQPVRCQRFYADKDYLSLLGIKVRTRYAVSDTVQTYVTPEFRATMGLKEDARSFRYNENYDMETINGVIDDFHLQTITYNPSHETTVVYIFEKMPNEMINAVLIKTVGDETEAYRQVQQAYRDVYHESLTEDAPYLTQRIASVYKEKARIAKIMSVFSFAAILISMLGLVAMSTYFIQQRSREIAVRKVFGSTGVQIRRRLILSFLSYVGIAFVVSVPIVWGVAGGWISQYSYRITWWPWIIVAGILVLLISFVAVVAQSWMASNENPVNNIKQE